MANLDGCLTLRARVTQWWERSLPTNVARVRILAWTPYVGWVCCWFSPLLREVFLQVLRFSPLLKNQHFQIPIRSKRTDTFQQVLMNPLVLSLRKHPFLLALRRWERFARRNVCDSATEIPYWWRKICPESGQKRWLVDRVVTLF